MAGKSNKEVIKRMREGQGSNKTNGNKQRGDTALKVPIFGVIKVRIFLYSD